MFRRNLIDIVNFIQSRFYLLRKINDHVNQDYYSSQTNDEYVHKIEVEYIYIYI